MSQRGATACCPLPMDVDRFGNVSETGMPHGEDTLCPWNITEDGEEENDVVSISNALSDVDYENSSSSMNGNASSRSSAESTVPPPSLMSSVPYLLIDAGDGQIRPSVWLDMALARLHMLRLIADNYARYGNGRHPDSVFLHNMHAIYREYCPWHDSFGDRVSHLVLSILVFQRADSQPCDKKWFVEQEGRLLGYRLVEYIKGRGGGEEETLLDVAKCNRVLCESQGENDLITLFGVLSETRARTQGMIRSWRTYYRSLPMPRRWFSVGINDAPRLFAKGNCSISKGKIYCGYRHIVDYVIPWLSEMAMTERLQRDVTGALSDWSEGNPIDTQKAGKALADVRCPVFVGEIGHGFKRYFRGAPPPRPSPEDLPDIEECDRQQRFPLCIRVLLDRLDMARNDRLPPRLCFHEIPMLRNTLWETGFGREKTLAFFRNSFIDKHGMDERYFSKEYDSRLGPACRWGPSTRSGRYDSSCRRLQDREAMAGKRDAKNEVGCPFTFLDKEELSLSLEIHGRIEDAKTRAVIVREAKDKERPSAACQLLFSYHHGRPPALSPRFPSDYVKATFDPALTSSESLSKRS